MKKIVGATSAREFALCTVHKQMTSDSKRSRDDRPRIKAKRARTATPTNARIHKENAPIINTTPQYPIEPERAQKNNELSVIQSAFKANHREV